MALRGTPLSASGSHPMPMPFFVAQPAGREMPPLETVPLPVEVDPPVEIGPGLPVPDVPPPYVAVTDGAPLLPPP